MKRYMTVAVAGHVDHGKTTLVRCLTGIDTDRMGEEKRRGLSIEAGIAMLASQDDIQLAMVDVPGHEDFMKNTIRGLSCVDLAILVVAADDGVMPQTRDHMEILSFSGVKGGIVILSKTDLVDEETLELAEMEIRDLVKGRFLQDKPIVRFSSKQNQHPDVITQAVMNEAGRVGGKAVDRPFRLWIDQIRHLKGFGTIVSGTVFSGMIHKDDALELMPERTATRARFIEAHGERVDTAVAGQRIGINLHKVPLEKVTRGMMLVPPGMSEPWFMVNGELHVLPVARMSLKNRVRLKVYMGTSVTSALLVIMEHQEIQAGDSALVQLRLSRGLAACPGDHFVVTLLNENKVLGGGKILEVTREKFTRSRADYMVSSLSHLKQEDTHSFVDLALDMAVNKMVSVHKLHQRSGIPVSDLKAVVLERCRTGHVMALHGGGFIKTSCFEALKIKAFEAVCTSMKQTYLKCHTHIKEIAGCMGGDVDDELLETAVGELIAEKKLDRESDGIMIPHYSPVLTPEDEELAKAILLFAKQSGFSPFSAETFCREYPHFKNKDNVLKVFYFLRSQQRLVRLANKRFLGKVALEEIQNRIFRHMACHDSLTLAESQDILSCGRTLTVTVMEYLDSIGFTRRRGDFRVLAKDEKFKKVEMELQA